MLRVASLAATIGLTLLLTACGGDSNDDSTPAASTPAASTPTSAPQAAATAPTSAAARTPTAASGSQQPYACSLLNDQAFQATFGAPAASTAKGDNTKCAWTIPGGELNITDITSSVGAATIEQRFGGAGFVRLDGTTRQVWYKASGVRSEVIIDVAAGRIFLLSLGFGQFGADIGDKLADLGRAIDRSGAGR